ncbi:hypothetical protein FIBSPDRAFT_869745 [Athelia psychrophila]|uniref:AGC-kinase C-terminal domain-containing protein n=1 Tax=Athelia psychrophila TaxID=1759441 RepID=A0A166BUV0_9AGAM|nr:hypothetical protein FIBSPDRAFT_869745 [Fibularhizoctonia sp. CBS 109695]
MELAGHIHEDIDACLGDTDDRMADLLHTILQADARRRPSWAAIQQHPYFSGVDWERVKAREANGDVHLPPVGGLKPFLPGMASDGMKFDVSDDSLRFESASSARPYSTAVHGTAFVISSDRYANILS